MPAGQQQERMWQERYYGGDPQCYAELYWEGPFREEVEPVEISGQEMQMRCVRDKSGKAAVTYLRCAQAQQCSLYKSYASCAEVTS